MTRPLALRLLKLEQRHKPTPELAPFIQRRGGPPVLRTAAEVTAWRAVSPATRWPEVLILGCRP